MSAWWHLLAVLLCPGVVAVVVPAIIVWRSGDVSAPEVPALVLGLLGAALIVVGVALVAWTVTLFARVGRGTLAPWDPTSRRFGDEHERYKANVPRWLPRRRPWDAPD